MNATMTRRPCTVCGEDRLLTEAREVRGICITCDTTTKTRRAPVEFDPNRPCTWSCKRAHEPLCQCSCRGLNHSTS